MSLQNDPTSEILGSTQDTFFVAKFNRSFKNGCERSVGEKRIKTVKPYHGIYSPTKTKKCNYSNGLYRNVEDIRALVSNIVKVFDILSEVSIETVGVMKASYIFMSMSSIFFISYASAGLPEVFHLDPKFK